MTHLDLMVLYVSILLYVCAAFASVWKGRVAVLGLAGTGWAVHTLAISLRWISFGHFPFITLFELVSGGVWFTVLVYILVAFRIPDSLKAAQIVLPFSVLTLLVSTETGTSLGVMTPALHSFWLVVHVIFALLAYGFYLLATGVSVRHLLLLRKGRDGEAMDRLAYRCVYGGFVLHVIMVATGAIWASEAWGRAWGWDPIEIWSLVTWLVYAYYLHLRVFFKWEGEKTSWFAIGAFLLIVLCYWAVPYFTESIHNYGDV